MKVIVFDFDGVILDSVDVKTKAFAQIYKKYGKDIELRVVDYHLKHGGISRYEKISYYHRELLGVDLTQAELNELAATFSRIVFREVCESQWISGAKEFLNYSRLKYDLYICTGTPEDEIKIILSEIGILKYFNGVFGSPKQKSEILEEIVNSEQYNKRDILFIGDALTDLDAASTVGVNFVGVLNNRIDFPADVECVEDLMEIVSLKKL